MTASADPSTSLGQAFPAGARYFPALEVRHPRRPDVAPFEAVAVLPFAVVAEIAVSSSAFRQNAKLSAIESAAVADLRPAFERVQRVLAGQKQSNVRGSLRSYLEQRVMELDEDGFPRGWLPSSVMYFVEPITIRNGYAIVPPGQRAILFDGDSRHETRLPSLAEAGDPAYRADLLASEGVYQILHGVPMQKARPWFADVNGRAVVVNANLLIGREEEDVYARVSRSVFAKRGVALELEKRQVAPSSEKILTAVQARTFVAALVLGVGQAVHIGAKPLPQEGVDAEKLEDAANEYLTKLLKRFPAKLLKDRRMVLRATPVLASLGALGNAWLTNDEEGKRDARAIIGDNRIDWAVGPRWAGLAGKINPVTGVFTVGGGKEYASQTWQALAAEGSPGWKIVRGLEEPAAAA
jgi:hypothetical protein